MSAFSIHNVSGFDRPYEWGYATPRAAAAYLWEMWNGPTNAARVAAIEAGGRFRIGDGTVALPAFSFLSDPDSGLYRIGADQLGFAVGGAKVLGLSASGVEIGAVTYPGVLGSALQVLRVNAGGTGLEFATSAAVYTDAQADARIATWARQNNPSGTAPLTRLPVQVRGRTSLYTVGTDGEWSNTSSFNLTVTDIDDYDYITISLWAGSGSTNKNARTVTILRSQIPETGGASLRIESGVGTDEPITLIRNSAGTQLTFNPQSAGASHGKIMGIFGGPF